MTWRGRVSQRDRIFASFCYLIPLLEALPLGGFFLVTFPVLQLPLTPLLLLSQIYTFPLIALAIFIGLYIGVVRNEKLRHFLRFNAMQSLLLAVIVYLFNLILTLIGLTSPLNPLDFSGTLSPILILQNAVFLAIYTAAIYAIVRSVQGLYAEMPFVSEAAYAQTR